MTTDAARAPFNVERHIGTMDTGYPARARVTIHAHFDRDEELHMTADAERPNARDIDAGGQMQDDLRALATSGGIKFAPEWDARRLLDVLDIWDRWHLNHMRASCEHQRALGWSNLAAEERTIYFWRLNKDATKQTREALKAAEAALRRGETVALPDDVAALAQLPDRVTTADDTPPGPLYEANRPQYEGDSYNRATETKTRGWLTPSDHPDGLLTAPCPECGYRYGTEWRKEEIPTDVLDRLRDLLTPGGRA